MEGTYILSFTVEEPFSVQVGAKGEYSFGIGELGYVGSGRGPGEIDGRVQRHMETISGEQENPYWHIDYILSGPVSINSIYFSQSEECTVVQNLIDSGICRYKYDLGSSDCSCDSHLLVGDIVGGCREVGLERYD